MSNVMSVENEFSQHQLVSMLLEGVVSEVEHACEQMDQDHVVRAVAILDALRNGLDLKSGGEIAENLHALYGYMEEQLLDGYRENNQSMLVEVVRLLTEVIDGWKQISEDVDEDQGQLMTVAVA